MKINTFDAHNEGSNFGVPAGAKASPAGGVRETGHAGTPIRGGGVDGDTQSAGDRRTADQMSRFGGADTRLVSLGQQTLREATEAHEDGMVAPSDPARSPQSRQPNTSGFDSRPPHSPTSDALSDFLAASAARDAALARLMRKDK